MKEQIIAILKKYKVVANVDYEVISADLEKLFQQTYLNECIEKATPNLSKIENVDKELAEIREEDQKCENCKYNSRPFDEYPCTQCNWGEYNLKWEPKTE